MNRERFDELLGLLLDEEISLEQLEELTQLISEDTDCLQELNRQLVAADYLSQHENGQRSAEVLVDS